MPVDRAQKFKVLAEENRLKILEQLARRPLSVNDIAANLDLPQSLVSHHLRILRDADFVVFSPAGSMKIYELADHIKRPGNRYEFDCCAIELRPPAREECHV